MTVHSAKGLEFPVVFVAAHAQGHRHRRAGGRLLPARSDWARAGAIRPTGEDKDDLFQHAIREERKQREEEESHRLLYVAMTRAEQHLVLSFSATGRKPAELGQARGRDAWRIDPRHAARRGGRLIRAPDGKEWKAAAAGDAGSRRSCWRVRARPGGTVAILQILPPPAVSGQHDTNATVTALCPRSPRARGSIIWARYLGFEGRVRTAWRSHAEEDGRALRRRFGIAGARAAGRQSPCPDPDSGSRRLADVFRQSPLGRRAARATARGARVRFPDGGGRSGDSRPGGSVVRRGRRTGAGGLQDRRRHGRRSPPSRARDYALQLRLYAMAVERVAGRAPDRAYLHFLRPNAWWRWI